MLAEEKNKEDRFVHRRGDNKKKSLLQIGVLGCVQILLDVEKCKFVLSLKFF